MIPVAEAYTAAVHYHLNPFYANWEPSRPLEIGDYGTVANGSFQHLGNIQTLGIRFDVRKSETADRKSFSSSGTANVRFRAKGAVPDARAAVEIQFSAADAVFFNAAGCRYLMIADKIALGRSIMAALQVKKWQRSWAVVTEVVTAGATTIVVSGSDSCALVIEAAEDIPYIDLADASVKLKIGGEDKVGYRVIGEAGMTPLIALSAVQRSLMRPKGAFDPLSRGVRGTAERPALDSSVDPGLFFADLTDERQLA